MEKIESFKVDHIGMKPGLYVSRKDSKNGVVATTFDLRMFEPNSAEIPTPDGIHTIEHIGATFFRNSKMKDDVIYFGPMGCRTGFYLVMFGDLISQDIYDLVVEMCKYILNFEGDIPGATENECGNYKDHNLQKAKDCISIYINKLKDKHFKY